MKYDLHVQIPIDIDFTTLSEESPNLTKELLNIKERRELMLDNSPIRHLCSDFTADSNEVIFFDIEAENLPEAGIEIYKAMKYIPPMFTEETQ